LAKVGDFGGKFIRCERSFADRFAKISFGNDRIDAQALCQRPDRCVLDNRKAFGVVRVPTAQGDQEHCRARRLVESDATGLGFGCHGNGVAPAVQRRHLPSGPDTPVMRCGPVSRNLLFIHGESFNRSAFTVYTSPKISAPMRPLPVTQPSSHRCAGTQLLEPRNGTA
jgi:hypothetical protein